jgi:pyrimidine-nucleoside phosphorylase
MLNTLDIIKKKRDGEELSTEEISYFIKGFLGEEIADYQMAAFLMAVFCRGFNAKETQALTEEMLYSGEVIDFSYLSPMKVDKHSTGGVGDKTSLVIAPIVAAAGLIVPMISGRALGHTGGTLDKLESIPGYNTRLSLTEFHKVIEQIGVAIIGQTKEIAPADKQIYSLRDVTATVDSIPLITASIMSKKLAEGLDCLLLDVKCGNGAFMRTIDDARNLAQAMVNVGKRMKKQTAAFITTMDQPLGWAVGNSLEVMEAIETLKGSGGIDFRDLCIELSAMMLYLGKIVSNLEEGKVLVKKQIDSGNALEKFRQMIEAQGGNSKVVDDFSLLPQSKFKSEVLSSANGYIKAIDTLGIGNAAMHLGAGRKRVDSEIDYSVGLQINAKIGDYVKKGQVISTIYYNDENLLTATQKRLEQAYQIGEEAPPTSILIKEIVE